MLLKEIEQKRSRIKNCFTLPRSVAGRIFDVNHVGAVVRRTRQNVMQASFAPLRGVAINQRRLYSFEGNDALQKRLGKHQEKVYDHSVNVHLCDL